MFNEQPKKTSPLSFLLMLVLFIGALAWLVPAVLSSDARWFLPGETVPPAEIVIWNNGRQVTLQPDDDDFPALAGAIDAILNDITGYTEFGASESTIAEYRSGLAVEAFYADWLKIHTRYGLGRPKQILFPLTGVAFKERRFYIGADDAYWAGSPRTSSLERLHSAVQAALTRQGVATSK
jgi:hypothetical protein